MTAAVARPRKRRRVERETSEYAGMVRRVIRRHGERVAGADPADLTDLVALRAELDHAVQVAVDGLRERHTWAEIGTALGITRQSAQIRFGRDRRAG